jgi:hypothetical protein
MAGVKLRYTQPHSGLALIPLLHKPLYWDSLKKTCPTCQVPHPVKTVHLWLDDQGQCVVSTGVLEDLKAAGMPDLQIVETVAKPPPLTVGQKPRPAVDADNRSTVLYKIGA